MEETNSHFCSASTWNGWCHHGLQFFLCRGPGENWCDRVGIGAANCIARDWSVHACHPHQQLGWELEKVGNEQGWHWAEQLRELLMVAWAKVWRPLGGRLLAPWKVVVWRQLLLLSEIKQHGWKLKGKGWGWSFVDYCWPSLRKEPWVEMELHSETDLYWLWHLYSLRHGTLDVTECMLLSSWGSR